jgi:hypothetical protein
VKKARAETRFLASQQETGFLNKDFPPDAKVMAETRFLASQQETKEERNRVSE